MPDLLTLCASSQPGKLVVIDDRPGASVVSWTYAQLEAEANRLANALVSLGVGVGAGEKVIWCGPNIEEGASARDARLAFVSLAGCQFERPNEPPLDAEGLTCRGLRCCHATRLDHPGAITFTAASFGSSVASWAFNGFSGAVDPGGASGPSR